MDNWQAFRETCIFLILSCAVYTGARDEERRDVFDCQEKRKGFEVLEWIGAVRGIVNVPA